MHHLAVTCNHRACLWLISVILENALTHHSPTVDPAPISSFRDIKKISVRGRNITWARRLMGNVCLFLHFCLSIQTREVVTRCSTGCCWIVSSSRWFCRMTKVTTRTSHHWRILMWRTLSGCESSSFPEQTDTWMSTWNRWLGWRM